MIVYLFSLCSNISQVKGRRNVAGEGLQQFGLSSALMAGAFETGVITAMTQDIGLQNHPYDQPRTLRTFSNPDPKMVQNIEKDIK